MSKRDNAALKSVKPMRLRRQRSVLSSVLLSMASFVFFAAIVAGGLLLYGKYRFEAPGPLERAKLVEVERGMGTRAIADALQERGVIDDARIFLAAILATRNMGKLKAGDYRFQAAASMREVLDDLVTGKALVYKLTIPEGLTSTQIVERVRANDSLVGDIETIPAEGSLLPETYIFERGRTRQAIIEEMAQAQRKVMAELWASKADTIPVKTPEEAIILASIVEKETGVASERPQVAAVFANRLEKGMRLQSDPTIIYGIVGGAGSLGRPLTRKDISEKTPYNTYTINGLPPTPIANPGKAAIAAVLNPATSTDLYFVADGTGGHVFAPTLQQHQANVRKWRAIERERRVAAGTPAQDPADEGMDDLGDALDDPADPADPAAAATDAAPAPGAAPAAQTATGGASQVASEGVPPSAVGTPAKAPAAARGPVPTPVPKPPVPKS
ncbi:endolytic transglycosylase MltG [Rhodoligotrophos appendicifer]|uniref:endolytic transglycosylase MltG n=1 Tax=Rhodoligotrophos appendicifer TaxID=987056 RepID=UPI001184FEA2